MEVKFAIWEKCSPGLKVGSIQTVSNFCQEELSTVRLLVSGDESRKFSALLVRYLRIVELQDIVHKLHKIGSFLHVGCNRPCSKIVLDSHQRKSCSIHAHGHIGMHLPELWSEMQHILDGKTWVRMSVNVSFISHEVNG